MFDRKDLNDALLAHQVKEAEALQISPLNVPGFQMTPRFAFYNPAKWFWLLDNNRLYSSEKVGYVSATDPLYLAWLAEDNVASRVKDEAQLFVILQAQYPAGIPVSLEEIVRRLDDAVLRHLEAGARSRGYGDSSGSSMSATNSIVSYVDDKNPVFAAEAKAFKDWRSDVWVKCISIMGSVKSGEFSVPTEEQLIAELPPLVWPTV